MKGLVVVALLPAALALDIGVAAARRPAPRVVCLAAKNPGKGFGRAAEADAPAAAPSRASGGGVDAAAEAVAAEARGRRALEAMRKSAGSPAPTPRDAFQSSLTEAELTPEDPTAGVMPQAVSDRMLARVVPFAALPVGGAFLAFVGFWFANTQLDLDITPQIVAYTTQALFLLGFGGITYGVMSTSWDEADEGSGLGLDEAKSNWVKMWGSDDPAAPNFKGRDADP